jgi:hypothetical protein
MWATWFSSAGSKQWWSATSIPLELMKSMECYGLGHHHNIHFAVEGPEHSRTFVLPELMKSLHCYCRLAHHQYHEFCCWRCWTHVPTANVCPTCISVSFLLLFSHFFWIRVSSFSRSGLELVSIIPLFSEIFIEFLKLWCCLLKKPDGFPMKCSEDWFSLDEENEVPGEEYNQLKQMMRSEPGIVVGAASRSCRLKNSSN